MVVIASALVVGDEPAVMIDSGEGALDDPPVLAQFLNRGGRKARPTQLFGMV